jgi:glycosyltransferase involved in cell wall biosynthesis
LQNAQLYCVITFDLVHRDLMRLLIATTHPIQYQAPLFRQLAKRVELTVVFLMRQTPGGQAASGFGVEFEWDTPLLEGYRYVFANNAAPSPSTDRRDGIVLQGHKSLLASLRPDAVMVMGWFPRGQLQVIRWGECANVPLICRAEANMVSGRSLAKRLAKFFYFRWLFRKFRAFAVIGKSNRDVYRHYGVPESRLHWAPYSVDTDFFESEFQRHRPPARSPGPWRIGFSGKLIARKRPLDLISAAADCKSRDSIQLVIAGDGPLRSEMEKKAQRTSVNVEMRGFLNQSEIVAKGYADLDALVLPSGEYETWGLVVNEAMTGGIPPIVSNLVGCAADLISEGETGYVFRTGDVNALSTTIDHLVERLESRHDFAPAVRERIADYSLEKTTEGILAAAHAAIGASA